MEEFWKATAVVLLSVIIIRMLGHSSQDFASILTIVVCGILAMTVVTYLEPVIDFLYELSEIGNLQNGILTILTKAVGIAFTAELVCLICSDAGCGSLGRLLLLLGNCAVLYVSLPVFRSLLILIRDILGQL